MSAERADGESGPADLLDDPQPLYALRFFNVDNTLGIRLSTTLDVGAGTIIADVAAHYALDNPADDAITITIEGVLDFANRVAIMTLVPYTRQAIADLSQRVIGTAVVMPIIRQGELVFGNDHEE